MKLTVAQAVSTTVVIALVAIAGYWGWTRYSKVCCSEIEQNNGPVVSAYLFDECALSNPVMESYPRQCTMSDGRIFIEDIGNELSQIDNIVVESPRPNTVVISPLTVEGKARGTWFFEGSFPITLLDWNGFVIAQGVATAKGDWMTEEFVPFTSTLEFDGVEGVERASIMLQKDNPSGLPEQDDLLEIPVLFDTSE